MYAVNKKKLGLERVLSACFESLSLSARESHILYLVTKGLTNAEIGARLFISQNTVANHVKSILLKIGVTNRTSAAAYAAKMIAKRKSGQIRNSQH
jgi:DNA-binding NarL/FixJ family response regulator